MVLATLQCWMNFIWLFHDSLGAFFDPDILLSFVPTVAVGGRNGVAHDSHALLARNPLALSGVCVCVYLCVRKRER